MVDRPAAPVGIPVSREVVQPQWIFDCINARALLPTHPYAAGAQCPAHLSPFLDGAEGYTPRERLAMAAAGEGATEGAAEEEEVEGEEDEDGSEEESDEDEDEDDDDEEEVPHHHRPRPRGHAPDAPSTWPRP